MKNKSEQYVDEIFAFLLYIVSDRLFSTWEIDIVKIGAYKRLKRVELTLRNTCMSRQF